MANAIAFELHGRRGALKVRLVRIFLREAMGLFPDFVQLYRVSFGTKGPVYMEDHNLPTSSLILDQSALLTYLATPCSLSTNRPNFLWTSGGDLLGAPGLE